MTPLRSFSQKLLGGILITMAAAMVAARPGNGANGETE